MEPLLGLPVAIVPRLLVALLVEAALVRRAEVTAIPRNLFARSSLDGPIRKFLSRAGECLFAMLRLLTWRTFSPTV